MPRFIIVGYMWQILERGSLFAPTPIREQPRKCPSWIGLMLMTKILVPFSNKLQICHFLVELRCIHRLERVLIARRLQFKKVTIMLKGESPKFKGTICNVPKYVVFTCNTLPHAANINGLVTVKLKKKLEYRGHICEGSAPVPFSHVLWRAKTLTLISVWEIWISN